MLKRIKDNFNIASVEELNDFGYRPPDEVLANPDKSLKQIRDEINFYDSFEGTHMCKLCPKTKIDSERQL